jgi:hypothetical protein
MQIKKLPKFSLSATGNGNFSLQEKLSEVFLGHSKSKDFEGFKSTLLQAAGY